MKPVLLALCLLLLPHPAFSQGYIVIDLGETFPVAISNSGQIVSSDGFWTDGKILHLKNLRPSALNGRGQIIGTPGGGPRPISAGIEHNVHALLWQNGTLIDLGTPTMSSQYYVTGINDSGQIIGTSFRHPVLWQQGRKTYLPKLFKDSRYEQAFCGTGGINNSGQSVGYAATRQGETHAVMWQNGRIVDLGGGRDAKAIAINELGQIAGYVTPSGRENRLASLWQRGRQYSLGTLPGDTDSEADAINNREQVVGTSQKIIRHPSLYGFPNRAFLWQNGKMSEMTALVSPHSGWHLEFARGINDQGRIIGNGTYRGRPHGFLLIPK